MREWGGGGYMSPPLNWSTTEETGTIFDHETHPAANAEGDADTNAYTHTHTHPLESVMCINIHMTQSHHVVI